MGDSNRREFLTLLGTGAVAGMGLTGTATAQQTPVVEMGNNYFDPIGLHVEPGTTVRFELAAGAHSATAYQDRIPADAAVFDSGTISSGSFEHTFETPGTYDYYCIPHESVGMVGRIVVGQPGGPAEDNAIPDGDVPSSDTIVEEGAVPYGDSSSDDGDRVGGGMMGGGRDGSMGSGMGGGTRGTGIGGWLLGFFGGLLGLLGVGGGAAFLLSRRDRSSSGPDTAMEVLRKRYARGELTDEEFETRRCRLQEQNDTSK